MQETLREILTAVINYSIIVFDFFGAGLVIFSGGRFIYRLVTHGEGANKELLLGFQSALEVLMGAEILRTIIVHDLSEILLIAGIILLRAAFSFIHSADDASNRFLRRRFRRAETEQRRQQEEK